jgi:hypothetical protein
VRLSPLGTAATTGLLYQPQMIDDGDCRAIGGIKIGRGNRSTRIKPAPAPLCPPQIAHDQTRARTRSTAVGSQRQTNILRSINDISPSEYGTKTKIFPFRMTSQISYTETLTLSPWFVAVKVVISLQAIQSYRNLVNPHNLGVWWVACLVRSNIFGQIDLKGFWRWCMLNRIHRIFLDFFHRPVFQKTRRFGNWIYFRPQVKVGRWHLLSCSL